jgi:hypothetical protein
MVIKVVIDEKGITTEDPDPESSIDVAVDSLIAYVIANYGSQVFMVDPGFAQMALTRIQLEMQSRNLRWTVPAAVASAGFDLEEDLGDVELFVYPLPDNWIIGVFPIFYE